jgi:selT/selW/selH-like putative selenoprotein
VPGWIDVAFCVGCNYQPRAASLAAALREAYPGAVVTLTPTGGGKFEVSADGTLVFSKEALGRHARPGEVMAVLQKFAEDEGRKTED